MFSAFCAENAAGTAAFLIKEFNQEIVLFGRNDQLARVVPLAVADDEFAGLDRNARDALRPEGREAIIEGTLFFIIGEQIIIALINE